MAEYYMFHKPRGCVTARSDDRHKTVMDYFPEEKRSTLFPVGRLDRDTEGLLIITDDGALTFKLLSPKSHIPKTYFFYAQGIPDPERLEEIKNGVKIYKNRDDITAPANVEITGYSTMREIKSFLSDTEESLANKRGELAVVSGIITITEGKKHQVKRMIRYTGAKVVYLKRLSMGKLKLDENLSLGEYRPLTDKEISILRNTDI